MHRIILDKPPQVNRGRLWGPGLHFRVWQMYFRILEMVFDWASCGLSAPAIGTGPKQFAIKPVCFGKTQMVFGWLKCFLNLPTTWLKLWSTCKRHCLHVKVPQTTIHDRCLHGALKLGVWNFANHDLQI